MGNLKFKDFRVVGWWLLFAAFGVLALPETAAGAAEQTDRFKRPSNMKLVQLAQSTSPDNIKNIQRLLTLLADRYKTKYGVVNPGRVDGSYGRETKVAIRKYQEISGIEPGSRTNEQLVSDILATLAQMSAKQPEENSDDDVPQVTSAQSQHIKTVPDTTTAKPDAAGNPATKTAKVPLASAPATLPTRERSAYTAPVPPAKVPVPAAVDQVTKSASQSPRSSDSDRVYFTQLASLRTLEAARREWQRIFDANRAALNGEQIYFEQAEIAGRGTFHRILVGPIPEHEAAKTLCGFLKQNDQPCVVTSRSLSSLRNLRDKNGKLAPTISTASGAGSTMPELTTARPQAATGSNDASPNTSGAQTATEGPVPPASVFGNAVDSNAAATAAAGETATNDDTVAVTPHEEQPPESGPAVNPIVEASKVFAEKVPTIVFESEDAKFAATVDTANLPVDAAAKPQPSIQGPKPAGEFAATSPETPPGTAQPPKAVGPPAAPAEAKAATLVPFSRSPDIASAPQDSAPKEVETASPPAKSVLRETPSLFGILDDIRYQLGDTRTLIGIVVVVVVSAAALLMWRYRNRRGAFTRIFQPDIYSFGQPVSAGSGRADALKELETDFDSEQLRGSRSIRDRFLRDILGDDIDQDDVFEKKEPAIRINRNLKSLLVSDPAQYKSIFLNWIFLSKVGAALNEEEIAIEDLNGHFGREFSLLQNYFKIHLLELDARHGIRRELPGLFYCLHLAQQRQRQAAGAA